MADWNLKKASKCVFKRSFKKSQSHDFDFFWFFEKSQSHDFDFFRFFQKSQSHDLTFG
jgi:hypothetical protein